MNLKKFKEKVKKLLKAIWDAYQKYSIVGYQYEAYNERQYKNFPNLPNLKCSTKK